MAKYSLPAPQAPLQAQDGHKRPSYYVDLQGSKSCYRASPTRLFGSHAKVRWAVNGHGEAVVLHTVRTQQVGKKDDTLELEAMAALGNDVAPLSEHFDHKGRRTLVLPRWHFDLFSLEATLGKSPARRSVGRKVLRDLASCYAKLHAQGLVHNDGKPENVLLRATGEVTLTDFDAAHRESGPGEPKGRITCWTHDYPAPEWGQPVKASRAVDVYLLGLTLLSFYNGGLYEAFAGVNGQVEHCSAVSFRRSLRVVAVLRRYKNVCAGKAEQPLLRRNDDFRARYDALQALREVTARLDPEVTQFIFNNMLVYEPAERATMPEVVAFVAALMPFGSHEERDAVKEIGRYSACVPQLRQQEDDLRRLRRLPPAPTQVSGSKRSAV